MGFLLYHKSLLWANTRLMNSGGEAEGGYTNSKIILIRVGGCLGRGEQENGQIPRVLQRQGKGCG